MTEPDFRVSIGKEKSLLLHQAEAGKSELARKVVEDAVSTL
jgi:hypothetical protein